MCCYIGWSPSYLKNYIRALRFYLEIHSSLIDFLTHILRFLERVLLLVENHKQRILQPCIYFFSNSWHLIWRLFPV